MPQNELHENNNLEGAKAKTGGRLTTQEYQICCAMIAASPRLPALGSSVRLMERVREIVSLFSKT